MKNKLSNISKNWDKRWKIRKIVEYWYWQLLDANSGGDGRAGGRGGGGGEEESQGAGGGEKCRESSSAKNGNIKWTIGFWSFIFKSIFHHYNVNVPGWHCNGYRDDCDLNFDCGHCFDKGLTLFCDPKI